jgi:hypothetical protein
MAPPAEKPALVLDITVKFPVVKENVPKIVSGAVGVCSPLSVIGVTKSYEVQEESEVVVTVEPLTPAVPPVRPMVIVLADAATGTAIKAVAIAIYSRRCLILKSP